MSIGFLNREWESICSQFSTVSKTIGASKEYEDDIVNIFRNHMISFGVENIICNKITGQKISEFCRDAELTLRENGRGAVYLVGMIAGQRLHIFTYTNTTDEIKSFISQRIPDFSNELAGILLKDIWVKSSIDKYARENKAITLRSLTTFLCQ